MTDLQALEGQIIAPGDWSPSEAAAHVSEAWQNAVDSIVETGRRLIEAKDRVGHGNWLPTVDLLPFSEQTARKLMQIARHPDISNRAHARDLPPSWYTLAVLAQLPPGEIPKRIEAGEITPELDRATAQSWANVYAASKQEALNAYSQFVDNARGTVSYTETYRPPSLIPDNYTSVAEVREWLTRALANVQGWDA